ncbi:hypothetical protein [Bradyrhizobium neotropicale]|nr:hypothetical protein [Bradyrhizobium neotropicale]
MTANASDTEISETSDALIGRWRQPRQILQAPACDAHASNGGVEPILSGPLPRTSPCQIQMVNRYGAEAPRD